MIRNTTGAKYEPYLKLSKMRFLCFACCSDVSWAIWSFCFSDMAEYWLSTTCSQVIFWPITITNEIDKAAMSRNGAHQLAFFLMSVKVCVGVENMLKMRCISLKPSCGFSGAPISGVTGVLMGSPVGWMVWTGSSTQDCMQHHTAE